MDMDDEGSELTDLDSDDYQDTKKTKSKPKSGGYKIRNALKVPRATTYTAQALYGVSSLYILHLLLISFKSNSSIAISIPTQNIKEVGRFFLYPPQNFHHYSTFLAVVWGEAKMISLVDSIFRNFYIPPIIFAVHSYEDGSDVKTCIDGKQRLASIQKCVTCSKIHPTGLVIAS